MLSCPFIYTSYFYCSGFQFRFIPELIDKDNSLNISAFLQQGVHRKHSFNTHPLIVHSAQFQALGIQKFTKQMKKNPCPHGVHTKCGRMTQIKLIRVIWKKEGRNVCVCVCCVCTCVHMSVHVHRDRGKSVPAQRLQVQRP